MVVAWFHSTELAGPNHTQGLVWLQTIQLTLAFQETGGWNTARKLYLDRLYFQSPVPKYGCSQAWAHGMHHLSLDVVVLKILA